MVASPLSAAAAAVHTSSARAAANPSPPPPLPQPQAPTVGKLSGDELWMAGVAGRVKVWAARAYPALKGREKEIAEAVRREYEATLVRRLSPVADAAAAAAAAANNDADDETQSSSTHGLAQLPGLAQSSPRARAQLRQACLAAATQHVFARELGGTDAAERDAAAAVAEALGSLHAPFLVGALRATSWVRRLVLRQSPFDQACQTLDKVGRDLEGASAVERLPPVHGEGSGAESDEDDDERERAGGTAGGEKTPGQQQHATLRVSACGVAELLRAEGVAEHLAPSFCCGHARTWFDAYEAQGVGAALDASVARGDGRCRLRVFTTTPGKD